MVIFILNPPGAMRSCIAGWQDIFRFANWGLERGGLAPLFSCKIVGVSPRNLTAIAQGRVPDLVLLPVMLDDGSNPYLGNPALLEQLQKWHQSGVALASACAGSFLLAAAGLLDGKTATTHWRLAPLFQQKFPRVKMEIGELLIEHPAGSGNKPGSISCAGGICAYIDLALAIIRRYGGNDLADQVARTVLWDPHRPRQAAYANHNAEPSKWPGYAYDETILKAEAWALLRLGTAITIPDWAEAMAVGQRSFERRFCQAHRLSPGQWLRQQRLLRARELCATSRRSWAEIAANCGYNDSASLRRQFQAEFGLSPREYRERFSPVLA